MDSLKIARHFKILLSLAVPFCLILIPVQQSLCISSEVDLHTSRLRIEKSTPEVSPAGTEEKFKILISVSFSGLPFGVAFLSPQGTSFPLQPSSPNEKTYRTLRC